MESWVSRRHGTAKLKKAQVAEAVAAIAAGESQRSVARRLGVSQPLLSDVVHGRVHRDVELPEAVVARRYSRRGGRRSVTLEQAREIRMRVACGELQSAMATEFGVSQATVSNIVTGRYYRS